MNNSIMKKVDEIYLDKMVNKGTITNLFGLNKNIDKRDELGDIPLRDQDVQTHFEYIKEVHTQTDMTVINEKFMGKK
jgi:hypothetical protein